MDQILLDIVFPTILFVWISFKLTKLEPETEMATIPQPSQNPARTPALSTAVYQMKMNEDNKKSNVDNYKMTTTIIEDYVKKLENDQNFLKQQIDQFQEQFQDLTVTTQGFETMKQENERLNEEVKLLQKTISDYEIDRQLSELLKRETFEHQYKLQSKRIKSTLQSLEPKPLLSAPQAVNFVQQQYNMTRKAKCDLEIAEKILFQSEIAQLKTELSAYKSQTEELKNDNAAMRFEASSKTSELDRLKEENHLVMANSNSFEERLVEKLCEIDQLTSYMIELENEISLLKFNDSEAKLKNEELKLENDELKKDVAYSRKAVAELQTKYQQLRDTRKSAMLSPEKSHQLAEGQVAALSEALTALQDAMTPTKEATADSDIGSAKREKIKKTMFTQMALGLESLIKHGSLTKKVIL